ncbi:hypothetical protein JCM10914A_38050 [Paenibacillus sp. JCM 10914]|uniref:hypothetical protein n=1 Tax=Paenibacillus sp. JCM 10914 TaxID=1236974 RepID=UPI0003CC7E60|nr:hypothetical protein [Paenibacillus sp. JCM 10914]GAE04506.1 hypothetical protein JCM10914_557 [Paenibacillus sp. JCM 10914]
MKRMYISQLHYGQEDIAELKQASTKVQHIFKKTKDMVSQYFPESLRLKLFEADLDSNAPPGRSSEEMFQKWVKGPSGWKFIDYEFGHSHDQVASDKGWLGRFLQVIIWSHYENILMLHPFLGSEPFFDGEELDVIANYFVPTYMNVEPLMERGKAIKKIQSSIVLYQEHIQAPAVAMEADGHWLEGNWMTGVNLDARGFAGISPYLKISNGERTYMEAQII